MFFWKRSLHILLCTALLASYLAAAEPSLTNQIGIAPPGALALEVEPVSPNADSSDTIGPIRQSTPSPLTQLPPVLATDVPSEEHPNVPAIKEPPLLDPTPVEEKKPVAETQPDTTPAKKTEETTTAISTAPVETPLDKSTTEMLLNHRLILTKVRNPEELLAFLRTRIHERNYLAAALGMAFTKTNYSTGTLQQECLAKWSQIIDRVEDMYPQEFQSDSSKTERLFKTANTYVRMEFVKDSNDCWQLGPRLIAKTDEIYDEVRDDPPIHGDWVSRNAPAWTHQTVWGLSYFRWSILGAGLLLGLLAYWVVQWLLYWLMRAYMHVVYRDVTRQSRVVWRQVALIVMAFVWFRIFSMVVPAPKLYVVAVAVFATFVTIMGLAIMMKVVDILAVALKIRILTRYPQYSQANVENLIVPLFSRSLKTLLFCVAVISLAQAYRLPIVGVLSGMGIGGIALAFAAKETVGNFFGSITVLIDQPFAIGDWIETDGVAGTVIAVGMRSTRVATPDSSVITIPNNNLTTAVINNLGNRRNRRFKTILSLQYDTGIDRLDAFCEGIRELILSNAFTNKEGFSVCLYNLGASSIDLLINVVFICPAPETENRERAKLLRNILKLAEMLDVRFAFPTQTLYLNREETEPYKQLQTPDPAQLGKEYVFQILNPTPDTPTPPTI